MHATRSAFAAFALLAVTLAGAAAQQSADTTHYVVLFSGRPAGEYREWWTNSELHSVYEYNDRGRGPHEESVLRVGAAGVPTSLSIVGHGYLKDSVDETFSSSGGTATWKTSSERGTHADAGHAYYVDIIRDAGRLAAAHQVGARERRAHPAVAERRGDRREIRRDDDNRARQARARRALRRRRIRLLPLPALGR